MSNHNPGRVLGRVLSVEQTAKVAGGFDGTCTPTVDDTGINESFAINEHVYPTTTIANDSAVWGEDDNKPYY